MANRPIETKKILLISAFLAVGFFIVAALGIPLERKFQVSVDEGFNLQRSLLFNQSYVLYSEIASDQPPIFTLLLARVLRGTGNSPVAARLLVLLFSAINIGAMAGLTGVVTSPKATWLVLPLFFILPWYMHLSTAIMIGLPAISLGSLALLSYSLWSQNKRTTLLIISALLIALSLLIKFFTAILAPIIFGFILYESFRTNKFILNNLKAWKPAIIWFTTFILGLSLIGLSLYGWDNILHSLLTHFGGGTQKAFTSEEFSLWPHVKKSWLFFVMALPGIVFVIHHRLTRAFPLLVWVITATIALSFYSPVWAHHQLLITVPLVGIQAIGIYFAFGEVYTTMKTRTINPLTFFSTATLLLSISVFIYSAPSQIQKFRFDGFPTLHGEPKELILTEDERGILAQMRKYAPKTIWVITDMPYYAFEIGKNVPPSLATFSTKMVNSGAITGYQVLKSIEDLQPEQVLLGRISIKQVNNYLTENYIIAYEAEIGRLYIRSDIAIGE